MTQMNWERLLDPGRLHDTRGKRPESGSGEIGRSPFHKDHDRIVFAGSFRRLGRKTQVHPLTDNDHIHTRLTHSLEVGCVGRSLGMIVGELLRDRLPGWITPADLGVIVQAACLGHDIGNPPFGHAGEYAIRDWFKRAEASGLLDGLEARERDDLLTYEGNAQGFRIVTQVEYNQFRGGMRLTTATLGTLLKYPWTVEYGGAAGKFGCYQSEQHLLAEVAKRLGLLPNGPGRWCRHPLAWLVEAADDICYALLDLEDGLEMGILRFDEVAEILTQIAGGEPGDYAEMQRLGVSQRRRIAALRGAAMERAVNDVGAVFVQHEAELLGGRLQEDLLELCHPDLGWGVKAAKQLARERIFQNERKAKLEIGAYTTLGILLEAFIGAAHELHHTGRSTFKHQRVLALVGENTPRPSWTLYDSYRRMLDFIGGMTDHYAVDLAQEMGGRLRGE
ncbi:deoxyguanosinetriphosphate triphosphohydrolase [Halomonas urumqiensis]|uniref:Deoxyguanosinetriphosphate triphosphohydrolase n=1 Tax=Halomonas urumqiensis TaxID=1684789 RepID=A0A2N7UKG9_9GAMM|nr:deoxyguanosinetriphosphate triphosphohydrolase [Halomonas urumqiensis]PMR80927.1 deoxyguanosinetriphosphate triphosphohydrolase [Halomonas urumqiensis]PTB02884.1 deoxyguanosinetriphosphate triphosphohydrolase [Halomonas urumqiensis]GHE21409.1 deoxyguanosinetriphosphate triphosphohydrolase-like protein [Halomonas urumqiensis]